MKKSARFLPQLALASQKMPPSVRPLTPPTIEASRTSPPNCGVKPPGNISWKEKQFGSSKTCWRATGSGTLLVIATVGQLAVPRPLACSTSPMRRVSPPSPEKTPPRVLGFRKKKPPSTSLV